MQKLFQKCRKALLVKNAQNKRGFKEFDHKIMTSFPIKNLELLHKNEASSHIAYYRKALPQPCNTKNAQNTRNSREAFKYFNDKNKKSFARALQGKIEFS